MGQRRLSSGAGGERGEWGIALYKRLMILDKFMTKDTCPRSQDYSKVGIFKKGER